MGVHVSIIQEDLCNAEVHIHYRMRCKENVFPFEAAPREAIIHICMVHPSNMLPKDVVAIIPQQLCVAVAPTAGEIVPDSFDEVWRVGYEEDVSLWRVGYEEDVSLVQRELWS